MPLEGKLFELLAGAYSKSGCECDIDISFNPREDGEQRNPCRDLILAYLKKPNVPKGKKIAERLEGVTTHRSGLGLLFLIKGRESQNHKLVISRFPTDVAILAEEEESTLNVEFLERVFMKNYRTYKAALYEDSSLVGGFWVGRAIDKQRNDETQLAHYWINEFLDSDLFVTSALGTRRLARALRAALANTNNVTVKREIASAATLAANLGGQNVSVRRLVKRFGLSEDAKQAIEREIGEPRLADEQFEFDVTEFREQIIYRSVELDTGGILTAQFGDFDQVFRQEVIDEKESKMRFSTEGKVVDDKLRKSK